MPNSIISDMTDTINVRNKNRHCSYLKSLTVSRENSGMTQLHSKGTNASEIRATRESTPYYNTNKFMTTIRSEKKSQLIWGGEHTMHYTHDIL